MQLDNLLNINLYIKFTDVEVHSQPPNISDVQYHCYIDRYDINVNIMIVIKCSYINISPQEKLVVILLFWSIY